MNHSTCKTMKEVVSQLREGAAEALLELFELHIAMGEVTDNAQVLSAAAERIAEEIAELAKAPEFSSSGRLRELAAFAVKTREIVEGQSKTFAEIQRNVDAWHIAPSGLRLVESGRGGLR
jgi:hypothetical protein